MNYFAEINNKNIVIRVIIANNIDWCIDNLGGDWIQTKYDGSLRKQFGNIGYTYNANADVFITPQPFASWSLDENFDWQAPTPKPIEGRWYWDEASLSWVESTIL